jgi:signal transduction histidine kinase
MLCHMIDSLTFELCAKVSPPVFASGGEARWLLYVLGLISVLCLFFALRLRQLTARHRVRMADRESRTRELQDSLLQTIEALILRVQTAADQISESDPGRPMLEEALSESDDVLEELRERILGVGASSEINGLPEAFAVVCTELKVEHPADFSVVVNGRARALQTAVREAAYRIGREALTNAFHHANAARCETEINYDRHELRISFRDDGCGVDTALFQADRRSNHWGFSGMHDRAHRIGAHLEIWSRPGMGTEVELRIPAALAYPDGGPASRWHWLRSLASGG